MKKINFTWGDKYEIKRNNNAKFKTNGLALIGIFIFLSSFLIDSWLIKIIGKDSILPIVVNYVLWISTILFLIILSIMKYNKVKVIDMYLITASLLGIISILFLSLNR